MKRMIYFAIFFIMTGFAFAQVGSMDTECINNGFDFGIAKWEYVGDDENGAYVLESEKDGYDTDVEGDDNSGLSWTSNLNVAGVITKESTDTYTHPGGLEGTIEKTEKYGISHVTFCGRNYIPPPPPNGVPEFSTIALVTAIIGGIAGLAFMRRQ